MFSNEVKCRQSCAPDQVGIFMFALLPLCPMTSLLIFSESFVVTVPSDEAMESFISSLQGSHTTQHILYNEVFAREETHLIKCQCFIKIYFQ